MGQNDETPREAAERFRRIIAMTDDKRTIEAVSTLIAELESKADAEDKERATNVRPRGSACRDDP